MTLPDAAALLDVLDATWAAEERRAFGGWVLRRGGPEAGSRVSSLRVLGPPDRPEAEAEALAAVGEQARGWGQPPIAQIGPADGALDARLDALGWTRFDPTVLLAAPAAEIAARGVGRRVVVRVRTPLAILDDLQTEGGGASAQAVISTMSSPRTRSMT